MDDLNMALSGGYVGTRFVSFVFVNCIRFHSVLDSRSANLDPVGNRGELRQGIDQCLKNLGNFFSVSAQWNAPISIPA